MSKFLIGALVALAMLAAAAPAHAARPLPGNWGGLIVDPTDDDIASSVQFIVTKDRKRLTKVTIYWHCQGQSAYHSFRNPPIPIGINKQSKFKLVGATTPPSGQTSKVFTLQGKFISAKRANFSMKVEGCGPKVTGQLKLADD